MTHHNIVRVIVALALMIFFSYSARLNITKLKTATSVTHTDLARFEAFAPTDAEVLFVIRPKQLDQYKPLQTGGVDPSLFLPMDVAEIELIAVASSQDSIRKVWRAPMATVFERMNAELEKRSPKVLPTAANFMNNDFCALIRFAKPTEIDVLETLLLGHVDKDRTAAEAYRRASHGELEILDGGPDRCSVVKLAPQTFVIGNRQSLNDALNDGLRPKLPVNARLRELVCSNFRGELFLAADVSKLEKTDGIGMMGFATSSLGSVQELKVQLSLNQSLLAGVEVAFDGRERAAKFQSYADAAIEQALDRQNQMLAHPPTYDGAEFELWQTQQMAKLAESLSVQQTGNRVTIKLPRPADLDQRIVETFQKQKEAMEEMERNQQRYRTTVEEVLVWRKTIQPGQVVQADDFATEQWPAQIIPEGTATSAEAVIGQKVRARISKGLPVMTSDFQDRVKPTLGSRRQKRSKEVEMIPLTKQETRRW